MEEEHVRTPSKEMHMSFEEPPWLWSESTWPLSSALSTPRAPVGPSIQTENSVCSHRGIQTNVRAQEQNRGMYSGSWTECT